MKSKWTSDEEMLAKAKGDVKTILISDYMKATIVPWEDHGEFHVLSPAGRECFTTFEAACKWASMLFLLASAMPSKEEILRQMQEENDR